MRRLKQAIHLTICLNTIMALGGCFTGVDVVSDHIKGDYYMHAADDETETSFILDNHDTPYLSATIVKPTVTRAGWNDKWVLIEQAPHLRGPGKIGSKRQYWVFSLLDEELFGPYNQKKFVQQRVRLEVPATLDFDHQYVKQ